VPDAVRLATQTGDLDTAQTLAGHATTLAAESEIPHRQANTLYGRGLLDRDASWLLAAAERYNDAGRPLQKAKALEAAGHFIDADGPRPGTRRVHPHHGGLGQPRRSRGRDPAPGHVPRPRHPARAARQARGARG